MLNPRIMDFPEEVVDGIEGEIVERVDVDLHFQRPDQHGGQRGQGRPRAAICGSTTPPNATRMPPESQRRAGWGPDSEARNTARPSNWRSSTAPENSSARRRGERQRRTNSCARTRRFRRGRRTSADSARRDSHCLSRGRNRRMPPERTRGQTGRLASPWDQSIARSQC